MNRFKRIAGSIVLAASLMLGVVGVVQPAKAAETVTIEAFTTEIEAVGAKITELAKAGTVKVCVSGSATMMGMSIPLEMDMDIDATSMVGHGRMPMASKDAIMQGVMAGQLTYEDMYMDLTNDVMYIHDEKSGTNLITYFPAESYMTGFGVGKTEGNMFTSMLTPELIAALKDHITITAEPATVDGVPCQKIDVSIKYAKGEVREIMERALVNMPQMFLSSMGNMDMSMFDNVAFECAEVLYVTADHVLLKSDTSVNLDGFSFGGMDLGAIKVDVSETFAVSQDKLSIPADRKENLLLAPNNVAQTGGVTFLSNLDDKGKAFFIVTGIPKSNAKKLVIPAKVSAMGISGDVSSALDKVFKDCKKLKTLVVKNAALKKAIKKNPKKYGLKKGVKIK